MTAPRADSYNGMEKENDLVAFLLMPQLGFSELIIILGIAVLLFGGRKIPEVAKGLGEGIRNFKHALKGDEKVDEKKQA